MRIATWNTLWRFGEWQERQSLLATELAGQQADVVLLQETWPDQAEALAAACGLSVLGFGGGHFDQTMSSVPADELFGNAVLARSGRIVVDEPFASEGDPAPRRLVAAEVDGTVVASVHLNHIAERGDVRAAQVAGIAERLRSVGTDLVIGGDLNMIPSSPEYRAAVDAGLTDAWATLRSGEFGATMVPDNPEFTSVAWMDDRNGGTAPRGTGLRFDYLWTAGSVRAVAIEVFGRADGPRWPSDHLGLVAEIDRHRTAPVE